MNRNTGSAYIAQPQIRTFRTSAGLAKHPGLSEESGEWTRTAGSAVYAAFVIKKEQDYAETAQPQSGPHDPTHSVGCVPDAEQQIVSRNHNV